MKSHDFLLSRGLRVLSALLAGTLLLSGCDVAKLISKSSYTVEKAKVLKSYSVTDGGYTSSAYVVEWKGKEIVVPDPTMKVGHKVGDEIQFLAQKIELGKSTHSLVFTLLD